VRQIDPRLHSLAAHARTLGLFSRVNALLMLLASAGSLAFRSAWPAAALGALSLCGCVVLLRGRWTPSGALGAANALTLLRLALIASLPALSAPAPGRAAALLVAIIFVLDGVDGWIARRKREVSAFGAYFDLECDALLVLLCTLVLYQTGRLGGYVLVPGLLRYVYVLLVITLPIAADAAPHSRIGRYAFCALILGFIASLWPLEPVHRSLAAMATSLVVGSFAHSIFTSIRPGAGVAR
jgi:phosphatidylglycerophosphate synthase